MGAGLRTRLTYFAIRFLKLPHEGSDATTQELIDRVLIIVCGYSLPTLIKSAKEAEQQ